MLSPFLSEAQLTEIFHGEEPLAAPELLNVFRTLIGTSTEFKPFECVGDTSECQAAAILATNRFDRLGSSVLGKLRSELDEDPGHVRLLVERLLSPMGEHFIPEPYASALGLE
jgi:hypothetical protein